MIALVYSQERKLKDGRNGNARHQNGTNGVMSNGVSHGSKFAKGEQVCLAYGVEAVVIFDVIKSYKQNAPCDIDIQTHFSKKYSHTHPSLVSEKVGQGQRRVQIPPHQCPHKSPIPP